MRHKIWEFGKDVQFHVHSSKAEEVQLLDCQNVLHLGISLRIWIVLKHLQFSQIYSNLKNRIKMK